MRWMSVCAFAALTFVASPAPAAYDTYLALGDSLAFGEYRFQGGPTDAAGPDRGYVGPFNTFLAGLNGGATPKLINLGVDGETSNTFFNVGTPGTGPTPGMPAYGLNTNYPNPPVAQNTLLTSLLTSPDAAKKIGAVTVSLGANDLYVLADTPGFFQLPAATQAAELQAALGAFATNYGTLLTELKTFLPNAKVYLLDYYDPFAPFLGEAAHPELAAIAQVSQVAIPALNAIIKNEAAMFGATPVEIHDLFVGNELTLTDIANGGNSHPTADGYRLIVGQLEAAAVPEPAGIALLGLGGLAVLGYGRRRRCPARA